MVDFLFWWLTLCHMEVPRLRVKLELQVQPTPHQIWAASVTYAAACSNAGSLTHWARPRIEPASSRTLSLVPSPLRHDGTPTSVYLTPMCPVLKTDPSLAQTTPCHQGVCVLTCANELEKTGSGGVKRLLWSLKLDGAPQCLRQSLIRSGGDAACAGWHLSWQSQPSLNFHNRARRWYHWLTPVYSNGNRELGQGNTSAVFR